MLDMNLAIRKQTNTECGTFSNQLAWILQKSQCHLKPRKWEFEIKHQRQQQPNGLCVP